MWGRDVGWTNIANPVHSRSSVFKSVVSNLEIRGRQRLLFQIIAVSYATEGRSDYVEHAWNFVLNHIPHGECYSGQSVGVAYCCSVCANCLGW